jgi:parallel beta-helix repeat protein
LYEKRQVLLIHSIIEGFPTFGAKMNTQFKFHLQNSFLWRNYMHTKTAKTLSAISLRILSVLMILSMLLSNVGITTASAASPSTISGNAGVASATITWNGTNYGSSDGSMTADSSGNYSFQVTYNSYWTGTVTPSKTGYTFSPSSRTYSYLTSNQTNQSYTATVTTYTISGSVGSAGGSATITWTGESSGSTTASSSGSYSFTVPYGWDGTVTPTKNGYSFSPTSRSYTNVTSNQTSQNYTATLAVATISGNVGVSSATITYTGGSTTSTSSGNYSFNVTLGWSGTITPSRTGYSFWPASMTYTNVTANQTGQNFTPRPTAFMFGSFGDSHNQIYFGDNPDIPGTAEQLASLNPALVLGIGDVEDNGFSTTEMNQFVGVLKAKNLFNKTFLVRGNHDDKIDGSAAGWESYLETFPNIPTRPAYVVNKVSLNSSSDNLVYSFDYGNSIFIGLDVAGDIGGAGGSQLLTDEQISFLDARLTYAENAGLTHAFIYFHGPAYCVEQTHCTSSARDDSSSTPPALMDVINNHPIVSATFHGHEHVLAWTHMDNTRDSELTRSYEQFVTSPAGASSYDDLIYPDRVDAYATMADDDQGFATISVNGLSFTVNFYKNGFTSPELLWSHTFSKVNNPPTISDITDKTTVEDTATSAIPFTVGDVELNPAYLAVTASSSDTTLIPAGNISLGGSGANRTISVTPAANEYGSATITVSVNDGNVTVDDTFLLTVSPVNDAPVADAQSISMPWNTSTNIVLTGSDVEGSALAFSIVDDPAHGSLSGSGANQQYTPTAGYSGTDSFTFTAYDGALYSVPATVSINVTAYVISGNAGVAGATLSYTDGTPKTVTADGSGLYSFQVPTGWSGTVTPSKAGYTFSPASMTYTNVLADQTQQNYSTNGVMVTISGYAGIAGATLSYTDGTPKTATADSNGIYSLDVSYNWSGTVTPSKTGYGFMPAMRTYANVIANQDSQDYTTTTARVYYVDNTNTNATCTDSGQLGTMAVPFCTIGRGANFATAGQIVQVLHGTYAETVYPPNSGTAGNPVTFLADPGVVVTGRPYAPPVPPATTGNNYPGFGVSGRSYVVIDGFTFDSTSQQGIYVDASDHITITNNHITRAGISSAPLPEGHPYTQGIYTRNTSYSTISHNITDYNTCIGIRVVGGGHNLISNNTSFENFSLVETDAAGIELTGSSYNTVINNLVYSNEDSGINVYYWDTGAVGSTNNIVVGNLSYENGDHGIDNYQSPNNWIIGNTVQGNGTSGINFEGNTGKGSYGSTVENNILSENGATPPSGSWGGNLRFDSESTTGATIDYNLFLRTEATVQIIWNNQNYTSLAAFTTAVPAQEVHGLETQWTGYPTGYSGTTHLSSTHPLFVSPVSPVHRQTGTPYDGLGIFGNYYPKTGAPEIDSANADAPNEQTADIDGNSRLDDPGTPNTGVGTRTYDDRGAYEYLPAGPSLPIVTTQAVTSITGTTATGNGTVTATGLPNPTQHGVVWGLTANPTVLDNKTVDGPVSATGPFTSSITDLTPGTLYHVRAYATNDVGTVYGEDVTFTTLLPPAVTTQAITSIAATTATGNGNVTALGVPNPTQHGVVWSTSANPTTADSKTTDGAVSAIGAFASSMTGLTPGTLYHVRPYVTNDAATAYGDEVTFTTLIVPTVTTQAVTNILTTTAVGNGNVTFLGIPNPTQHGVVWATTANPTTANSKTTDGPVSATGTYTSTITGLTPNTLYHVRAYATNTAGTAYGEDVTFTTLLAPTLTTQACTNLTTTAATGNGNITSLGIPNPTEHGVVWSTSLNPTIADNKTTDGPVTLAGTFTSAMTGLTSGTLYHVRAYATNDGGTSYGSDVTCTTLITPTVTTQAATNITQTTAMLNGTIVSLGVPNPTQYGFVWDINPHPTVVLSTKTEKGPATVTGAFTSNITGLSLGQTYYVRAYATNTVGTAYSVDDVVFTTLPSSSTTTTPVTNARTGADVSGTGTGIWISPGNITAADTNYATVTLSGATSHYLEGTNYGFSLPSNATINGIQVTIGRFESGQASGNDVRDSVVSLMKSSTLVGSNKGATSTEWPTSNTAASYGANNDLWGTTWTADDINATGFGVALSANSTNNRIASVDTMQIAVTYTVSIVSSTTSVSCGSGTPVVTYGSSLTCVATVVRGSGTFTPTGNVSWTTSGSGNFVTSPCTLSGSNGTASCSVTYIPSTVGTGSHLITATYAGDASFNGSNGSQIVTVNKKTASVTVTAASKTYGDSDPSLTGILAGFLPADNVTAAYSRTTGETVAGSPYTISATLSPSGVLVNYNITNTPASFTINKKNASVTVTAASKTYGDADPTLTGTLAGFLPADNVTAAYNRTAGETVAGSPYTISATLSPAGVLGNYNITNTPADFTINKKDASVVVMAASKTYGAADPTFSGTLSGFLPADNVTASYSRAAGETVAGSPYAITATLSPAGVLGNYNITNTPANFTINKKDATATPDALSKIIGTQDPILTGTLTGFLPADNVTAAYTRAAGEAEGTYPITATLSPAGVLGNYNITYTPVNFTILPSPTEYTLTINITGHGTVTKAPDQATYHYGDVVTLTATADPGWTFFNWSANAPGGIVTIHDNTTVTALFTQDEYTLTINKVGNGTVTKAPSQSTYHYGDVVTLTATGDPGWSFGSWSANVVDGKITIHGNTTVTATFTQDEYTLTINKVGNGSVSYVPVKDTYHYGDVVTLTSTADPGWTFASWSANATGGQVTIHGNTTVTATFTQDEYTLSINKVGNGTVTKAPDQTTYHYGDVVTLTATADPGWSFGSWSANVVDGKVTVNANTTVTATFTQDEYTLTINKVGNGTVTKAPDKSTYHYGDVVNLTATADPGWSFGSWSANATGGHVTIQGNTTVTATFTQDEYTLTINKVGNGTVTKDPDQTTYHYGDLVTLTATADPGWGFVSWSANVVDGKVTVNANTTVTATFTQDEYTLSINKVGNGTVTKDPDQTTYHYGDLVTLTATADPGWNFGSWSANATEGYVTIHGNTTVTVTFTQDEYTLTINKVGNGTVTKAPDKSTYHYGDVVNLTATADPGWSFGSWSANASGGHVTIQGNTTVTATFTQDEYTLTINKVGNGTVTKDPDQTTYHYGDLVTLTATADPGWGFVSWSANVVDGKVTVNANTTVTATFRQLSQPTVTTQAVTDIAATTATGNGTVTDLGAPNPTQHGVVWSTSLNPTIADSKTTDGLVNATGAFTSSLTGLTPGTLYHVRAYATNSQGTVYGSDVTFTALNLPIVTTQAVASITTTTATGNGTVTDLGVPNPTQHGVVWSNSLNPTIADSKTTDGPVSATGTFTTNITGLIPYTLYHVRAYATNNVGTAYGDDVTFTTQDIAPTVTTQAVSNITDTTASGNGNITVLGVPTPTQYGVVWDTAANPTIALSTKTEEGVPVDTGVFTSNITGLTQGTLYHVRAYVTNAVGTFYGDEVTFTTIYSSSTTTPATNARTGTNVTGVGTLAWTNPGYITADDTSYATASVNQNVTTNYLEGTNYGFAIPSNATINGIGVTIGRYSSGTSSPRIHDVSVNLIKGGTIVGSNKAATTTDWPTTSIASTTYGSNADLWSTTWTPADINANNFGVALSVNNTYTSSRTAYVDYIQITVTYSVPTAPTAPIVTTQAASNIASTTATGNGNVTSLGVPNPTQYGVVWDISSNPTVALATKTEQGPRSVTGAFTSSMTGLAPYTLYHVRAYATNIVDTVYGDDVTFTTLGVAPTVTASAATNITTTTATGNGNITVLGVPNPTQYGVVWSTSANPTVALSTKTQLGIPAGTGAFTSSMTGLTPGTLYYWRAYATNAQGTAYNSADLTFTTTAATVQSFTSSGSWTVPAGVTSVTVEVWGGGGRGGSVTSTSSSEVAGGGGGGGAYSKSVIAVTPGQVIPYVVGAGSTTTTAGGDSYFINASTVMAKGGSSAADNSTTAAAGGASGSGFGTTKYSGGTGAAGTTSGNYGGGGGSSAGTAANGTTATNATGATAPTGGGNGGSGRSSSSGVGTTGSTPGGAGGGAYRSSGTTTYAGGNGVAGQVRLTFYVSIDATTTSVNCGAGTPTTTYGGSISCVATVTAASGTTSPSGTVAWTSNGAGPFVTSPCTLSGTGGSASCSVTYTPTSVGTGAHLITASYAGDTNFLASIGSQTVTVNKLAASVTPNAASKTYGDADPASFSGTLVGFLAGDNVTATYSRLAGETVAGSPYTISATLSPAGVLANYTITYNTANFAINKKDASVTPNNAGKQAGEPDPVLTGTMTGFLTADNVTATYTRASGEAVEGSPYLISASLSPVGVLGNYNIAYNTADFSITAPTDDYMLTITIVGNGTVTKDPDQGVYHYGDVVTLTPTPDPGWSMGSWSANVVAGQVTIHGNTTVTATFTQDEYTLTIDKVGNGSVTKAPDQATYHYGAVVTLTATADPGWTFGNWSANVVDGKVTVNANTIVTATFTNTPPSFTSTPVTDAAQGALYTYNVATSDPDLGAALTITAPDKPAWLTLTDNGDGTAVLTGTPAEANVGMNYVTLHVSDGTGGVDQSFTIDVGDTNEGPSFTSSPVTSATQDTFYTYTITADDPDAGDTLAITASTLPAWLTLTDNSNRSATLTGTPANANVGDHSVVLQVTDSTEMATQSFTITVENVNDAPVLAQPADQSSEKGATVSLQLLATDVDVPADTLTYSASGLPGGLSIDPASGLISGTLTADPDTYSVTASVDDGNEGTDSKTFTWTVTETATYSLTISIVGQGTVTKDPDQATYLNDTVVTLAATPDTGWSFGSWSENVVDGKVTINGNTTVTVTFIQNVTALSPGIADDADPLWSYSGDWIAYAGPGPYSNTLRYSGTIGDFAEIVINGGQQIKLTYSVASNRGVTDVYIDGVKFTSIDSYSPGFSWQVTWSSDVLTSGLHTIRLVHASGAFTDIDAIEVFAAPQALQPGIADDSDALWNYSGDWTTWNGAGPASSTLHYSGTIGDSAKILISGGQQIKLTYLTTTNRGITDVYIDGVKVTSIDAYAPGFNWQVTWSSDLLTSGFHTVRLVHASGAYTDIDAIEVIATPQALQPGIADDSDALWSYNGAWTAIDMAGPYSNTFHYSSAIGDSAQIVISGGQQIKLTYLTTANRGITDVYIDGVKVTSIDAYAPGFNWLVTWSSNVLTSGLHTVRLVHASGAYTDIDAIEVIATPQALQPGIADDSDPLWNYYGVWATINMEGPYSNTLHYSSAIGDSAQILISGGQQIKLTYSTTTNRGITDVYIDGVKVTSIDAYAPGFNWQVTWSSDLLTSGFHTVRLVHASGEYTDIDALEVLP